MASLVELLGEAVNFCRDNRDRVRRVPLGRGLQVRVYAAEGTAPAEWHVLIIRPVPSWPSLLEAKTVMEHWPIPFQPKIDELEVQTIPATLDAAVNGLAWVWVERVIHG